MNGAVTWETIFGLIALASAVGGLWWRIQQAVSNVRDELTAFRLEVAKDFIRSEHLQKMEERIVATETRTLTAIEALTKRIDRLIEQMPKARATRAAD